MTLEQLSAAATQELLPCPFCGCGPSNDEHAQQVQFYREISAPNGYVWCEGCGAEGPWRKDRDEAIAAWNHRTGQLVAVQPDDATVERVKDAIGTSLAYDIGMDVRAGSLTDDEKRKVARKAIAAMPSQADLHAEIDRLRMELQNIAETTDDEVTSRQAFIALSKGPKL